MPWACIVQAQISMTFIVYTFAQTLFFDRSAKPIQMPNVEIVDAHAGNQTPEAAQLQLPCPRVNKAKKIHKQERKLTCLAKRPPQQQL